MSAFARGESRKFIRVSAGFEVRILTEESGTEHHAVFARDISTGGLGLVISDERRDSFEELKKLKEPVEVEIDIPSGATLRLRAALIWGQAVSEESEERFRMGLRFLDIDSGAKELLERYVKSKAFEFVFPPKE